MSKNKKEPIVLSEKSWTVTLLLAIFLGWLGIHRFYVGRIGFGILWLVTGGVFLIGWIVDIIIIATGEFTDSDDAYLKSNNWKMSHFYNEQTMNNISNDADELLRWKVLFDEGAITKEEYEMKKHEILFN